MGFSCGSRYISTANQIADDIITQAKLYFTPTTYYSNNDATGVTSAVEGEIKTITIPAGVLADATDGMQLRICAEAVTLSDSAGAQAANLLCKVRLYDGTNTIDVFNKTASHTVGAAATKYNITGMELYLTMHAAGYCAMQGRLASQSNVDVGTQTDDAAWSYQPVNVLSDGGFDWSQEITISIRSSISVTARGVPYWSLFSAEVLRD